MALAGARLGIPTRRTTPQEVRDRPIPVNTKEKEGPFYETAGGIPVSKPFYRKKVSIDDYVSMRKREYGESLKTYRLGKIITEEEKDA